MTCNKTFGTYDLVDMTGAVTLNGFKPGKSQVMSENNGEMTLQDCKTGAHYTFWTCQVEAIVGKVYR